jgi:hypothetical protein
MEKLLLVLAIVAFVGGVAGIAHVVLGVVLHLH